jgi:hypothetical protein
MSIDVLISICEESIKTFWYKNHKLIHMLHNLTLKTILKRKNAVDVDLNIYE